MVKKHSTGRRNQRSAGLHSARGLRPGWFITFGIVSVLSLTGCREIVVQQESPARNGGARTSYADVVSNVAPCVVSIFTHTTLEGKSASDLAKDPLVRRFIEQKAEHAPIKIPHELEGLGSGVIVSKNGYILTSSHVVSDADKITVTTDEGKQFHARLVGLDPAIDVAVLKIEGNGLPVATLADSSRARVGDVVLAIGNALGVGQTVTSGIISATERGEVGVTQYEDFIQTDAPVNPGNSGGALVDAGGRVIGINSAILTSGGGSEGIAFAVPINLAFHSMKQIITRGRVVRGYLGAALRTVTPDLGQALKVSADKGALVARVEEDSPAAKSGLQPGDVIVEANGQKLHNSKALRLLIAQADPGTSMHLKVIRSGQERDVCITLAEKSAEQQPLSRRQDQAAEPLAFF